jgi:hypothetical protein
MFVFVRNPIDDGLIASEIHDDRTIFAHTLLLSLIFHSLNYANAKI